MLPIYVLAHGVRVLWQFAVPDVLFVEALAERHGHLLQFGLISKTMDGDLVSEAYTLRQQYAQTSVNDLLAFKTTYNFPYLHINKTVCFID